MKRWYLPIAAAILVAILTFIVPLKAGPAAICTLASGGFIGPDGSPLNGVLTLTLSNPGQNSVTSQAVGVYPVTYRVINGVLPSSAAVVGNDAIQPQGTYYKAVMYDTAGNLLSQNNYIITGASFNFGQAVPTSLTTSQLSFQNPAFLNVASTWSATQTFGAGITGSGTIGTLLPGTGMLGGNNNWSGVETHIGVETFSNINSVINVTTCTSAGINTAISAQIALGGGTVDAHNCPNLTSATTSEIDVGNSSGVSITLLLPPTGIWPCNVTDGVSYCIKVFNNSAVIGTNAGYGTFQIQPANTASVGAVCGNDTSISNNHIRMEGFNCNIFAGQAVVSKSVGYFSGLGDLSVVNYMTFGNLSSTHLGNILWVNNSCCSTSIEHVVAEAYGIAGVTPCNFGNATTGPNVNINVSALSCVHPGSGNHVLLDQEYNQFGNNHFQGIYIEQTGGAGGAPDLTTSTISVQAYGTPTAADYFTAVTSAGDVASATRYTVDIASGAHAIFTSTQQGGVSTNSVNDHNGTGKTYVQPVNSNFSYTTEEQIFATLVAGGVSSVAGCSLTGPLGGAMAGVFFSGTSGACTVTITFPITAPTGYTCDAHDLTTVADVINQTTYSQTTAIVSGTTVSGDRITWKCTGF